MSITKSQNNMPMGVKQKLILLSIYSVLHIELSVECATVTSLIFTILCHKVKCLKS